MKNNFIKATVFITALILTPVTVSPLNANKQVKRNSVVSNIATILHKRGLDENAAQKISQNFVGENEELFALMLRNLENGCSKLTHNEILDYLSNSALFRKNVNLHDYSQLVSMFYQIKNEHSDKTTLQELENIATKNSLYI